MIATLPFELWQGDCLELMKDIPDKSIDMVFTDLPYGTTQCRWDTPIELSAFWSEVNRVTKPAGCKALFAQSPFDKILGCSNIYQYRYEWIWEKTQATGHLNAKKMPLKAHENILIFYDRLPTYNPQMTHGHKRKISTAAHKRNCRKSDCYSNYELTSYDSTDRYPRSVLKGATDKQTAGIRAAQKPVWLCEKIVLTYTNEGETVLDCCMGTGSIGIACVKSNRKYIGIDSDDKVFNLAKNRIEDAWEKAGYKVKEKDE